MSGIMNKTGAVSGILGTTVGTPQTLGHRNFIRNIVRHANYVKHDSQGRIAIPDILLQYSKITKDVLVIGMLKKIELWNPDILRKFEEKKGSLDSKDFEELADKINF